MLCGTPPKYGLLLAGLLLVAAAESRPQRPAQEVTPVPEGSGEEQARVSHELYESGRIQFSAPPPTVDGAGVQCDHDGNIYLIYAASLQVIYPLLRAGVSLPVSKLSLDSKGVVQFPVGQFQGYAEYQRPSFFVDPLGKVEGLVVAYPHERGYKGPNWPDSLIVKYKDDGTVDSVVKLDPPLGEHFQPWSFAAFLDGNFLVTGAVLSDKYMPKQPFTAIFDRGGGFVRLLTLPHDVRPRVTEPPPLGGSSGPPPPSSGPGRHRRGTRRARTRATLAPRHSARARGRVARWECVPVACLKPGPAVRYLSRRFGPTRP